MKWKICFLAVLWPFVNTLGQSNETGLTIGDRLSNEMWAHRLQMVNLPDQIKTVSLEDYKGKVLILDFWETSCGTCIAVMPKMQALQNVFEKEVKILAVTSQARDVITKFRKANGKLRSLNIPSVVADTFLNDLFPHRMIPHVVWIDKTGKIAAITSSRHVNESNIRRLLKNGSLDLPVKRDVLDYNGRKPLLVDGNGGDPNSFLYRSLITGRIEGIQSMVGTQVNKENGTIRLHATNLSIISLFALAYNELYLLPRDRVILKMPDSSKTRLRETPYCYDLILPLEKRAQAPSIARQDLNRFFDVNGRMENRVVKCLEIINSGAADPPPQSGLPLVTIPELIQRLRRIPGLPPLIGNTKDLQQKKVHIDDSSTDIRDIQKQLRSQGFELRETERELRMLVISATNHK